MSIRNSAAVSPPARESSDAPAPQTQPSLPERLRARVLVVGSGVAGLHTAWRASADGDVMVLTKRSLFDSATAYAQGGIAAALGAGDSPELHRLDTLAAGAALCDAKAVQVLVEEGPARVRELATAGAQFDLEPGGNFKLGKEAAHSRRRIVHAHGDQTGAEVARTLIKKVKESERIDVSGEGAHSRSDRRGRRRVCAWGSCRGQAGRDHRRCDGARDGRLRAGVSLYNQSRRSRPAMATRSRTAPAPSWRTWSSCSSIPTALDTPENPLQLISEAVRGEGAILLNEEGERFMLKKHRLAELAPRDVVAREIFREKAGGRQVWLDARKLGRIVRDAFSGDLRDLPGARYRSVEGPDSGDARRALHDGRGRHRPSRPLTSLTRLYACGEVSRTGVHGANRLASNSLLEGLVFAERVARDMIDAKKLPRLRQRRTGTFPRCATAARRRSRPTASGRSCGTTAESIGAPRGCGSVSPSSTEIESRLPAGATEEANMVQTSLLIAEAALLRKESRGGHYRVDFPRAKRKWATCKHIEW